MNTLTDIQQLSTNHNKVKLNVKHKIIGECLHFLVSIETVKSTVEAICLLGHLDMVRELVPVGHETVWEEISPVSSVLAVGGWTKFKYHVVALVLMLASVSLAKENQVYWSTLFLLAKFSEWIVSSLNITSW